MRRGTYLERRWPNARLFEELAPKWCADHSRLLLALVWRACDQLVANDLAKVPFSANDEAKEETLNFLVRLRIDQCMSGDEPSAVVHEAPEQTKRKPGRGKSPHPDIGFVLYDSPRAVWPLEGKVLRNETDVGPYVSELVLNLLPGRYATFSSEGGLLGYMLQGSAKTAFQCMGVHMKCELKHHPAFREKNHRMSQHDPENARQPDRASRFCCHHLLVEINC